MTVLTYSNDMFASSSLLVWQHASLLSCALHVNSNGIAFELAFEQVQDYYKPLLRKQKLFLQC